MRRRGGCVADIKIRTLPRRQVERAELLRFPSTHLALFVSLGPTIPSGRFPGIGMPSSPLELSWTFRELPRCTAAGLLRPCLGALSVPALPPYCLRNSAARLLATAGAAERDAIRDLPNSATSFLGSTTRNDLKTTVASRNELVKSNCRFPSCFQPFLEEAPDPSET